jgi:hypothetical protein
MLTIRTGLHSTGYRTTHQDRYCRQDPVGVLRRLGLFLPPPPNCTRRRPEMAERNTGSCLVIEIVNWIPWLRLELADPRNLQLKFHDSVPCHRSFVSDALARPHVFG